MSDSPTNEPDDPVATDAATDDPASTPQPDPPDAEPSDADAAGSSDPDADHPPAVPTASGLAPGVLQRSNHDGEIRWWRTSGGIGDEARAAHTEFIRDVADRLRRALRCEVELSFTRAEWVSGSEWLSGPTTSGTLARLALPGAEADMGMRLDSAFVICALDRLLGGAGTAAIERDLTSLELDLSKELLDAPTEAISKLLRDDLDEPARLKVVSTAPQHVRFVEPTDPVLLITFDIVTDPDLGSPGTLWLCYPEDIANTILDRVRVESVPTDDRDTGDPRVPDLLTDVEIELVARLQPCWFAAEDLRRLQIGDVVGLDHHRDQPIELAIHDAVTLDGALGRRGRAVAIRISSWRHDMSPRPATKEQQQ